MGKYTVYNDPEIDLQIDEYLRLIVNRVLIEIDKEDIQAIVLAGGFGRGEGGIVKSNNTFKPVNDFDISIFPAGNLRYFKEKYSKKLSDIAEELTNQIPIKQVDLGVGDKKRFFIRLFKIAYTVNAYEFIHGHKILYGNIKLGKFRRFYKNSKIPLIEGTKYFYTRGSGMLIPAVFFNKSKINEFIKESFFIEINKAILAMGDSFLILKKKYHYSYNKRKEIATDLDFSGVPSGNIIKTYYLEALGWKLKPNYDWIGFDYHVNRWFELQNILSSYFLWYENIRLKKRFPNWIEYSKWLIKHNKSSFINKVLKTDHFIEKLSIMTLLLFSINRDFSAKSEYLEEATKNLEKHLLIKPDFGWNNAAIGYLKLFHPEGIIQKLS